MNMEETLVRDLMEFLNGVAPFDLQEDYDNAGLIVGRETQVVTGVIVSLDATEEVIEEAIDKGCNVVLSHHPILFKGIKRLNGSNYVERAIIKAIKNDIALIAIHTNLDNVLSNGVNERIAMTIGLQDIEILRNKNSLHTDYLVGSGVIGFMPESMPAKDFLVHLKEKMKAGCIKYTEIVKENIRKVAICGGSGGFLLNDAIGQRADIFVTSDYKYHEFFDADGKIIIADIGHYESEQYTIDLLLELIKDNFITFAAHYTNHNTNPVKYL